MEVGEVDQAVEDVGVQRGDVDLDVDADIQGGDVDQAGGEGEEVEGEPQFCRQEGWRPHLQWVRDQV